PGLVADNAAKKLKFVTRRNRRRNNCQRRVDFPTNICPVGGGKTQGRLLPLVVRRPSGRHRKGYLSPNLGRLGLRLRRDDGNLCQQPPTCGEKEANEDTGG